MDGNDGSGACPTAIVGKPRRADPRTYAAHHLYYFVSGALFLAILVLAGCQGAGAQYAGSWTTFGDDPDASQGLTQNFTPGADPPASATLSEATVGKLHEGWSVSLPNLADVRPILVRNVTWPDGTVRDVLYLTTDTGMVLALNAA